MLSLLIGWGAWGQDSVTIESVVIVLDGDPAPSTEGAFSLTRPNITLPTPSPPFIDDDGEVFFFAYSVEGEFSSRRGIWSGTGETVDALAIDGQILPAFLPSSADCLDFDGFGAQCGEIFNTMGVFYVTPNGKVMLRTSRADNIGPVAILSGNRHDNLSPIVTSSDLAEFPYSALSQATESGTYLHGTLVGTAPYGEAEGGLIDFAAPFIGGAAPFIVENVTITDIHGTYGGVAGVSFGLNQGADRLFIAELSDMSRVLYFDPFEEGATTKLLARTGDEPAGIPGGGILGLTSPNSVGTTGTALINDSGDGFYYGAWRFPDQPLDNNNAPRSGLWSFDSSGTSTLVVSEHLHPDFDPLFVTSEGPRSAFDNISRPRISADGDIYFYAVSQQADENGYPGGDESVGLWRKPADGGSLVLDYKVTTSDSPGSSFPDGPNEPGTPLPGGENFTGLGLSGFGFDENGNLVFSTVNGLYAEDPSGDLHLIVARDDEIDVGAGPTRVVSGFDFEEDPLVGGTSASFRNGSLAFSAKFDDGTTALMRSTFVVPPKEVIDFLWSGACENGDWHGECDHSNWDDAELGPSNPAEKNPGDANGTETVKIENAAVVLSNRAVHIKSIETLGGSLELNQALTIESPSSIENLVLKSDLLIKDDLTLSGAPEFRDGTVTGTGRLIVDGGAEGSIVSAINGGSDTKDLDVELNIIGKVTHDSPLLLDLLNDGKITIEQSGQYLIKGGGIINPVDSGSELITNKGTFASEGPVGGDPILIGTHFRNEGGSLNVPTGALRFENILQLVGGQVTVDSNALMEVKPGSGGASGDLGILLGENFTIRGGGTVMLDDITIDFLSESTLTVDMDPITGGLELNNGTILDEGGALLNKGRLVVNEMVNKSRIVNEGTLLITGSDQVPNLAIEDGVLENKSYMKLDQLVTLNMQTPAAENILFENKGTLELEAGAHVAALKDSLTFKNNQEGKISKTGSGMAEIEAEFLNEGALFVFGGSLMLRGNTAFGSSVIGAGGAYVEEGAQLVLGDPGEIGGPEFVFVDDYELAGTGDFTLESGQLRIPVGKTLSNLATNLKYNNPNETINWGGSFVNKGGAFTIARHPANAPMVLLNDFTNRQNGQINFETQLWIALESSDIAIENEGEFNFSGGPFLIESSLDVSPIFFNNAGFLSFSGGGEQNRYPTIIEVPFRMRRNSKLLAKDFSDTSIFVPFTDTVALLSSNPNVYELLMGEWEVEAGSQLSFHTGWRIHKIGESATVTLHGIPGGNTPDGTLGRISTPLDDFENAGRLNLKGATIVATGDFINSRLINCQPGRFEIPDNFLFKNTGNVSGNVVIAGDVLNKGFISAGNSAGTVSVEGDFTQEADGELYLELGGSVPGEGYDQLLVSGTATLGGRLRLACLEDVFPDSGTVFSPISAGNIVGEFDEVIIDVPSSRQRFDVEVGAAGITAQAEVLSFSSYGAWQSALFSVAEQADANISGENADPDGDDLSNLMEYVLDGNPRVVDSAKIEMEFEYDQQGAATGIVVRFPWANDVADGSYMLQSSPDLQTWTNLSSSVIDSEDLGLVTRIALGSALPDGDSKFARLIVTSQ